MKVKKNYKELIIKTNEKSKESEILKIMTDKNDKYYFFNKERNLNIIKLTYKFKAIKKFINILGKEFENNNKKKYQIMIKNKQSSNKSIYKKEYKANKVLFIDKNNFIINEIIKIKLQLIDTIIDLDCLFEGCDSLLIIKGFSKLNSKKIKSMCGLFKDCSSLLNLPDISKLNTNKVINIKEMFYNISSLKSLPDISKWNTKNVTNISELFYKCSSLESLPDA